MQSIRSSKKTKFKIRDEYSKSEDLIQSQSSHRQVNTKKEGDTEAKETLNFQREQMQNIREKIFFKKVVKRLHALISLSRSPSDFTQEWQREQQAGSQKLQENPNIVENIDLLYPWMKTVSILQGLSLIIILWMLSISVVFQQKLFTLPLFIFLAFEIIFLSLKSFLMNCNKQLSSTQTRINFKKFLSQSLAIVACSFMLVRNHIDLYYLALFLDLLVSIVLIVLSRRVSSYFQIFRIYAQNQKMIKELRIIEMFCILFVIAHFFGLIIYSSTYITPQGENSWISLIKLQQKTWKTNYIYSIYWAITTIATVGYGDLTPQNQVEVIIVVILQICGTSFFGYMINVIGITVDNINKKNVEYDNYQQTISKLKDQYQLSDALCHEMKNDIKHKYQQSDKMVPLKKNQETELLQFVDSTVKKNFILQTNIKIIKKSIFFLTYFTVNFQNQIALKLIRSIYKKDQNIQTFDIANKQRNIVIINHGKVSLFLKKKQNNSVIYKLGKPTLNVVGYSNLILNQDIAISAVANEMTSGYVLKRSDVLECIDKSLIDYQNLHQMRQKMLLIALKESIQAPSLKDSDFHFTPNVFILTCRHSKQSKQFRKKKARRNIKSQVLIDQIRVQFDNDWFSVKKEDSQSYFDQEHTTNLKTFSKKINQFQSLLSIEQTPQQNQENNQNLKQNQSREQLRLDQVKIFEHFMKNHNISTLASQYQKSCKTRSYTKRIMTKLIKAEIGPASLSQKLLKKLNTLKSQKNILNMKG